MKAAVPVKTWTKTSVQNLVRHKSGRYYARLFIGGKERWKTLGTDLLEVAKVKLREIKTPVEATAKAFAAEERGRMTLGDCGKILLQRVNEGLGLNLKSRRVRRIAPGTQRYRRQIVAALWKSWPELSSMDARRPTRTSVEGWAKKFEADYSATRYNAALDTLRAMFQIAQNAGVRADNPADAAGRMTVKQKTLVLPSKEQFGKFVNAMRTAGGRFSNACADLVEFLAYTGARKDEAAHVTWGDVDFIRERIHLRIVKGGHFVARDRRIPMIQNARTLLERLQKNSPDITRNNRVLGVQECQKAMDLAAEKVGMARITHHDLRHLFATQCIESGVDIPTVSRWLGHLDGGALAMKTYGHLRDEHSAIQAKKVSFTTT